MSKFANRTTIVKGFIINPAEQKFDAFECETAYVRATEKAAKMVAEKMGIEAPNIISVTELVNERVEYDPAKIFTRAKAFYHTNEDPDNYACDLAEGCKAVPIKVKSYAVQAWVYDEAEGSYRTVTLTCNTAGHISRNDVRASMVMRYESEYKGVKVIATHDMTMSEQKTIAIITSEELVKCVK